MESAKILFVEGENATIDPELQSRIRRLGHSVLAVVSLEEWIQGTTESRPDVVLIATGCRTDLTDIEPPDAHHPSPIVPVVQLVDSANTGTPGRLADADPRLILTRPFNDHQLSAAIEMALHHQAAESALRESGTRSCFLARNVSHITWTTDLDMRLTDGMPSVSKILGRSVEETLGEKMTERLTPASREVAANALAQLREADTGPFDRAQETETLTLDFVCEHTDTVRTRARARVLRDSAGEPSGLLWVAQQIAEPERTKCENSETARAAKNQPGGYSDHVETETALRETRRELERTRTKLARALYERQRAEAKLDQLNCQWLYFQMSAAAITSSLDIDLVLNTVTREMTELLEADGCAIFRRDPHLDVISLVVDYTATVAAEQKEGGQRYDFADHPLGGRILVNRRPQQITAGKLEKEEKVSTYMQDGNIRSLLALPMIYQGRLLGFVEVRDCQEERTFADRRIGLAQMLAAQAASAIENARLYEHAQEQITERMLVERELRRSVQEKEALLQEIHHRVKNNLQVISSLLNLRSGSSEDPETRQMLKESQNRVRSMALIHEKLYQSQDLEEVAFGSYIQDLTNHLMHSYGTESAGVRLKARADDVSLGIDKAVPCGLIINELVSNALKHAFPDGREGEIVILLRLGHDQHLTLSVADDGVGLPADSGSDRAETLGLELIRVLTDQMDGTMSLCSSEGNGTKVSITFPAS